MQIELYNFSKKSNSTARPNVTTATVLECQLKDKTSMLAPTIIVRPNLIQGFSPAAFNYAHIAYWQRFYYISDWEYDNAVWVCRLACDILASFRTQIGNMNEYILRSSYEKDGSVIDPVYGVKTVAQSQLTSVPTVYIPIYSAGFFIVGIIGKSSTAAMGAVTYYQLTAAQTTTLLNYLLSDTFFQDNASGAEVSTDLLKLIYNPIQYVVSCTWFPFAASSIPAEFKTEVPYLDFGWWQVPVGSPLPYRLLQNVGVMNKTFDITVPHHPQEARGEYLNHSPFTTHVLRLAPFEDVIISDQYITGDDKIHGQIDVDPISGNGVLNVYIYTSSNLNKMLISRTSQKIGVDIQLSQVGVDYYGGLSTALKATVNMSTQYAGMVGGAIGSILTLNLGGAVDSAAALGAYSANEDLMLQAYNYDVTKQMAPQLLSSGHNGSMIDYKQFNYLCSTFCIVTDNDNDRLGSPLCKIRTIKNIPGFIVVMNPSVNINCTDIERTTIARFMSAGFYYE